MNFRFIRHQWPTRTGGSTWFRTADDMARICSTSGAGNMTAAERDALITETLPLIKHIAHRVATRLPSSVEIRDLINAGVAWTNWMPSTSSSPSAR
jgi:hypothetical protein